MKIRIFQPIVPEYRVALFDGLAERYGENLEVWASAKDENGDVSVPLKKAKFDYSHVLTKIGPFFWQRGFSLQGLARGDVIVINGNVRQLSSMLILVKARLKGIRVVWWGHHLSSSSKDWRVKIRIAIMNLLHPDALLFYTNSGVKWMQKRGVNHPKMFATGNTIDQVPIQSAMAKFDGVDRFNGSAGLLCCSVLREKVRLDLIIKAMADRRLEDVRLAVIGDGPMKEQYLRVAAECGVEDRIIWLGATRDQEVMAPWFLSAKAFVYPGAVGLSILHSLSYGLPVVVHGNVDHQMPEFEVMEDGKTGFCFREGDVGDLVEKVRCIVSDEVRRKKMSEYSKHVAYEKYSMKQMVANYARAIEAAAE